MARLKTDWVLFFTIVGLVGFGLIMVYSASYVIGEIKFQSPWHFFIRQILWAVASFGVLMYLKKSDYRQMRTPTLAFAALGIVISLLVVVYFWDARAHSWFRIPSVGSLQPSEFAKPALAIFLAYFVTARKDFINNRKTLLQAALAVAVLAFLVVVADLGTALVLVLTAVIVLFVAGLEWKYVALVAAVGCLFLAGAVAARGYRLGRVIAYFDKNYTLLDKVDKQGYIKNYIARSSSNRDPSYQGRQSVIATGSGGVFGEGLMRSRQKLLYLPEAQTDFIYAIVGEELGLWGCTLVLGGFLLILWRGLRLYWLAPDEFGRYLALGVTIVVVIQAFVNISVVLDMGPTKGLPLPMISAGGSSLLATLTSMGLLLSVSEHAA